MSASTLDQIDTPALIVDRTRLDRNVARMREKIATLGVTLRPHLKTAKSVDVARRVLPHGGPITVSTLREAEHFASHGFKDLFYAVAIAPHKLERVLDLLRTGARVLLAVDDAQIAAAVDRAGRRAGVRFELMIEIDSGEHRSGVAADSDALLHIVAAAGESTTIAGVFTHGGHSYSGRSADAHAAVAEQERRAVTSAAARLRALGHSCPIVSLGSTPSILFACGLDGVTEARAGVYMFGDLFQAGVGVCRREDIAVSVLATVIGQRPQLNRLLVDAGSLALSKDVSTRSFGPNGDCGYGLIASAADCTIMDGMFVETAYQEHGIVKSTKPIAFEAFPIGTRVRILPNHACLTAAAHDRYHVVDSASNIAAIWPRVNGW